MHQHPDIWCRPRAAGGPPGFQEHIQRGSHHLWVIYIWAFGDPHLRPLKET